MHCIVLLGPPGAGKGTQGRRLSEKFRYLHFSTGDLIRNQIAADTEFGRAVVSYQQEGKLVPDDLLLQEVSTFFVGLTVNGIVADGFPRTATQAKALDAILMKLGATSTIIHLETALSVIMERALSRRTCVDCGAVFNLKVTSSKCLGICDFCGGVLVSRKDDTEAVIAVRYDVYEREISGLLNYYGKRVLSLDGTREPDFVFSDLEMACGIV
jgi:adenylate kinase